VESRTSIDKLTRYLLLIACALMTGLLVIRTIPLSIGNRAVDNLEPDWVTTAVRDGVGDSQAQLVMIEFADFQCEFCGQFARQVWPTIRDRYVKTGKLRFTFLNFPLPMHGLADRAAQIAECARDSGRYGEIYELLFSPHASSLRMNDLTKAATAVGLSGELYDACLKRDDIMRRIRQDQAEAERLGIVATPTFLIGRAEGSETIHLLRRIRGAEPFETFRDTLRSVGHF
jgi:protein-disulfide isomerase